MKNKILIVEDNILNMKLFNDLLQAHGYETLQATRGANVLELTHETQPDLILMDIELPDISGLKLTKMLRTDRNLTSVPIIAITALAMINDKETINELFGPLPLKDELGKTVIIDQYFIHSKSLKSIKEIIDAYRPIKGIEGVLKVFMNAPNESWNPKTGSWSWSISWVYEVTNDLYGGSYTKHGWDANNLKQYHNRARYPYPGATFDGAKKRKTKQ